MPHIPVKDLCCRIYTEPLLTGESKEICLYEGDYGQVYSFDSGTQYFNMEGTWDKAMSSWECGANVFVAFCNNKYDYDGIPFPLSNACEEQNDGFRKSSNKLVGLDKQMSSIIMADLSDYRGQGITLYSRDDCSGNSQAVAFPDCSTGEVKDTDKILAISG